MNIYESLLAKAINGNGGGGGGGSSDFSTAEVTLYSSVVGLTISNFPHFTLDSEVAPDYYEWDATAAPYNTPETYSVVLYKGVTYAWLLDSENAAQDVSVTGSIEYDSEEWMFTITGNGTITIS